MFSRRRIQRHGNEFVYFLIYRLFTTPEIPPVTLTAIIFQTAVFLDFIPFLGSDRIREMCLMPSHILYRSEWLRMIASPFMHASDMHLFFNMISLLWKGKRLEPLLGSSRFLFLLAVFTIFTSGTMVGLSYLADELMVLNDSDFMSNCAIGFSGVIFALKVLHTTYFPHSDQILFQWFIIPSKYACWIELFLIKLYVPNSSFIGHLSGILVGLAYTMGPLKMLVDFLESVIPLQFGLISHSSSQSRERPSPDNNFMHGDSYFSFDRRPYGWGYEPNYRNYDEYTGGFSEEEQMRRARERSYRDNAYPSYFRGY